LSISLPTEDFSWLAAAALDQPGQGAHRRKIRAMIDLD